MKSITAYIHFPWCLQKCPYCDFVSFSKAREAIEHRLYADAVLAELARRAPALAHRRLESVFFGGGTPSLWEPEQLGRVLDGIVAAAGEVAPHLEITVECNPSSLDEDRARGLLQAGVNRLSVGVQGLDEERLRFLGRLHAPEGGLSAVRAAIQAGLPRVSGDLIYGVASGDTARPREQDPGEAAREARTLARTGVGHVSAYSLTIEPGTRFGELSRRGRLPLAAEDGVADAFLSIEAVLEEEGFTHYEVSNYARKGEEARHNLGYWTGVDYVGLGCAAVGTVSDAEGSALRYRNLPNPDRYMAAARAGTPTADSEEPLDAETRLRERIMLGLRLRAGLDLEAAAAELGIPAWSEPRRRAADRLARDGRLEIHGGRLTIPARSWLLADGIAASLF
ncbi:radical SAM family heme chaperone HemW [Chondromyces apiculatus]|uniref:Heme chaperone HemW n=1 Tax=Chondromyces apiculatus DSM 436 TaxID=1192034 RepID=A0A017T1N9_9BACT|nr:radical SAM family heme chaperone HemW [Chondromyces apiculatus]EYF02765.1 Radical SAM family enzyme / coproporphyrinogen III oxidase [Chondromyces apiculatus DSM 436]